MILLQNLIVFVTCFISLSLADVTDTFYEGCLKTKGCQGFPGTCLETKNCTVAVSYQGIAEDKYTFEIIGKVSGENKYVASGLSPKGSMADSSVVACFYNGSDPKVVMTWNDGSNGSPQLKDPTLGLSDTSIVQQDSLTYCKFTRNSLTQFETPVSKPTNVSFDLNNDEYTIIFALGSVSKTGLLQYHDQRYFAKKKVSVAEFNFYLTPIYIGCSTVKGCYGFPLGCIESRNCTVVASYSGLSNDKYKLEIYGKAMNEMSSYVAMGLSTAKGMNKASVIACSKFNVTKVEMYYNENFDSKPLNDTQLGLSNATIQYSDGYIYCSVVRDTYTEFKTPSGLNVQFDLNETPYYILLSNGPLSKQGFLAYHLSRDVSQVQCKLSDYNSFYENIYDSCGDTKGCVGYIKSQEPLTTDINHSAQVHNTGCILDKNCSILATYAAVSANQYKIEIYGKSDNETSSYVAVGISVSESMTETSVIACSKFNDNTRVEMYWNDGHQSKPLMNTSLGLSNPTVKYSDGFIYCSVIREANTKIITPFTPEKQYDFDLNTKPYYILLARGPLANTGLLSRHSEKMVTDKKYNFLDFNSFNNDVYLGCGTSKGCFGYPDKCLNAQNCQMVSTYSKLENGDIKFEISGQASESNYLALGLSNSEKMYSASVMFCYAGTNDNNGVALSWNVEDPGRNSLILADPTGGLKDIKVTSEDGKLKCTFVREKVTSTPHPTDSKKNITIDLAQKYHLLLAMGSLGAGQSSLGFVLQSHGADCLGSVDPVDLGSFSGATGATLKIAHWHGSLMVVAWLFFALSGTMTARYGKSINAKVMGKDIWFRIHQVCMGLTWALSFASLILMWSDRGVTPLSWENVQQNGHAAVGMAAFVLAFIQPFMAFFRPHPDDSKRPIFNVAHQSVGMSAILLSFVAIGLATKFETLNMSDGKYLLGAFCAFYLIFHVILTVYLRKIGKGGKLISVILAIFSGGALATTIGFIVYITGDEN